MNKEQNNNAKVIAFDLDGVLAQYNGFVSEDDVKEPNPEVFNAIKILKEKGYKILIHSTRGDDFLKQYCKQFDVPYDYINRRPDIEGKNPGKPIASVYVDDRAVNYNGQSASELVETIENFQVHWRK